MVLSQSLRYLWRIFLAAWEATQQRPSSHKSEYLLHVNGLYFYTNTTFRAHQASESDTETTSFWNRFRVVYGRIHTNPDWKICGVKNFRIPVVETRGRAGALGYFLGRYVPPGTPNWHPVLKKNSLKLVPRSRNEPIFYTPFQKVCKLKWPCF